MSDLNQIHSALERLFHKEGHRVVFWNDPDQEFQNTLPFLDLEGVSTLRLDKVGALGAKIRIEREEPDGKFLLYAPTEEPDPQDDWLLDIRLYSENFRADRASILLQELGLLTASLREHLLKYRKFFDAKERLQKIKSLVVPDDTAPDLDRKMMAVVAKADQPELFNLVRTIFHAWLEAGNELDLDNPPAVWEQFEKFDLDIPFWEMTKAAFGYEDENPSLKIFLLRLLLTDFAHHLKGELPPSLRHLLLPKSGWANTVVCLAQWRDSTSKQGSYDRLSADAAALLKIEEHLSDWEVEQLRYAMTFLLVEKRIANGLRELVESTAETINADDVRAMAIRRQAGHWASPAIASSPAAPRQAFHAVYDAIISAADYYALRKQYQGGFDYPDASAMYRAYETDLYRFDQLYRRFCESADIAEEQGWHLLKSLRTVIERHYVNDYLTNLALAWGRFLEPRDGLLSTWRIEGVPNQYRFYDRNVLPKVSEADNRRAFVIISDAFRYEAAQELTAELNGKFRFEASLSSQLGVLPSYTDLGMASLMPHTTLAYKGAEVLVDGKSSIASERDRLLQSVGGIACNSKFLKGLKKDEGREFIKDKRVVYVYHDYSVDDVGDKGKTEGNTFGAVRRTINELASLVRYIVNNLNGHHVVITSDHGFLFAESPRTETEKSKLTHQPPGAVRAKKRYVIGQDLGGGGESVWQGKISVTAGAEGDMEFWIPKGANLFHFVGGARFVHGGAMPQEIVVPVITVKQVRGKFASETMIKSVAIQVLGGNHRITSAQHRFQLIQMEPVSDRVKPITLRIALYEGDEPVSDIQTVKFESNSPNLDDRKTWVRLVLKERQYHKKTPYRLVIQDAESGLEQQSVEVIIDRAITDAF